MSNTRTINYKKQVSYSFVYKILSVFFSFLIVRFMLQYLGIELYGVWSVLLVLISWIIFFDFGIANGIKNKVSQSLANDDILSARQYISTGYIALFTFVLIVYLLFFGISFTINWQQIFNIYSISNKELLKLMQIVILLLLLNFVLSIISAIFNAIQKSSLVVLNQFISQVISFFFVLFLNYFTDTSIVLLGTTYASSLLISNIILSIWFYSKNHNLMPSIKYFEFSKLRSIVSLGATFFILQLTILIILSTDKFIITQLLGPAEVSRYDILFKYFSAISILHTIINAPLWSIYTEAYEKNDYTWISNTIKRMIKIFILYIFLSILMIVLGDFVIRVWISNELISFTLSNFIYMSILTLILAWYSIFAYFTNGINKTKIQLFSSILGAIINIPLSIFFVKYLEFGLNGILLATILSLTIFAIAGPIQTIYEIRLMKRMKNVSTI
jgi:O-antigen/teichoic acid export membrane protein